MAESGSLNSRLFIATGQLRGWLFTYSSCWDATNQPADRKLSSSQNRSFGCASDGAAAAVAGDDDDDDEHSLKDSPQLAVS